MESISNYKLPTTYYALGETLASVISQHKTKNAAQVACEKHVNANSAS